MLLTKGGAWPRRAQYPGTDRGSAQAAQRPGRGLCSGARGIVGAQGRVKYANEPWGWGLVCYTHPLDATGLVAECWPPGLHRDSHSCDEITRVLGGGGPNKWLSGMGVQNGLMDWSPLVCGVCTHASPWILEGIGSGRLVVGVTWLAKCCGR